MNDSIPQNDPQGNSSSNKKYHTRICNACQEKKKVTEFYSNDGHRDKFCKSCRNNKRNKRDEIVRDDNYYHNLEYKICIGCDTSKCFDEFSVVKIDTGMIKRKDRCRECERFKIQQYKKISLEKREQEKLEEEAALMALPYDQRVKVVQRKKLKHRTEKMYGIPIERRDEMLKAQNGLCAICHNPPKEYESLVTDHDHVTGYVRGLLCLSCNWALGHFKDSQENLLSAVEYLKKSKWEY